MTFLTREAKNRRAYARRMNEARKKQPQVTTADLFPSQTSENARANVADD